MTTGKRFAAALIIFAGGTVAAVPFYHTNTLPRESASVRSSQGESTQTPASIVLQISADRTEEESNLVPTSGKDSATTVPESLPAQSVPPPDTTPAHPPAVAREFPAGHEKLPPAIIARRPVSGPHESTAISDRADETSGDGPQVHRIRDGDTLRDLAKRYLGNSLRWDEIFNANRDVLHDAEVLPIGLELRIPPSTAKPAAEQDPSSSPDLAPLTTLVPIN